MKKYTYEQLDKENEQYNKIIKEQQKEIIFYIKQTKELKELIKDYEQTIQKLKKNL